MTNGVYDMKIFDIIIVLFVAVLILGTAYCIVNGISPDTDAVISSFNNGVTSACNVAVELCNTK